MRHFFDYDAVRVQRKSRFEEDAQSRLEELLDRDAADYLISIQKATATLRKKAASSDFVVWSGMVITSREFLESVRSADEEVIVRYRQERQPVLVEQAREDTRRDHLKSNLTDLLACAQTIAEEYDGLLPQEERKRLYSRLVGEIDNVIRSKYDYGFTGRTASISELLSLSHPPASDDDVALVQRALRTLKGNKYFDTKAVNSFVNLLRPPQREEVPLMSVTVPSQQHPVQVTQALSSASCGDVHDTIEERLEFLTVLFELPEEKARLYLNHTLNNLHYLYGELSRIVGEDYAVGLVQVNPDILNYHSEGRLTKYFTTLELVRGHIRRAYQQQEELEQRYGIQFNLGTYADLDQLLELKRRLFGQSSEGDPVIRGEWTLEDYKDALLQRTGLDGVVVRALTEGKNKRMVGGFYAPRSHFQRNIRGKVPVSHLGNVEPVFESLVECGVLVRKPTGDLYSLNPRVSEITHPYLREYMRITLHAEEIVAQEGGIWPNRELVPEFFQ